MAARPIGVVLAGGAGSRMGRTKGDLLVGGTPLAGRAATALEPLCEAVVISVRPGAPNPAPGYRTVADAPPAGRGPLAGILAAFEATAVSDLLVLACDYPHVGTEVLRALVHAASFADDDVTLAVDPAGRDHPLVALWSRRAESRVRLALEGGRFRVGELIAQLTARRVRLDGLVNVNRPEDLAG